MYNSFTHSLTHPLSAQCRVLVENLRVSQLVKKAPFTRTISVLGAVIFYIVLHREIL